MAVLLGVGALVAVVAVIFLFVGKVRTPSLGGGKKSKDRETAMREANKRLGHNPNDPQALYTMAGIYLEEEAWESAMKTYENLIDHSSGNPNIDMYVVFMGYGKSARKLNMLDQAYKGFSMARGKKQDSFEVNYELGALEFERRNYEKAVVLLQAAQKIDPDNPAVLRWLGHSFFRLKKPKEAMSFIRRAIDLAPEDKESLYTLGECYQEANQTEQALRVFNHLRADPGMGPTACLNSGIIHIDKRQYEAAIQDLEIGLKHQNIRADIHAELQYRIATTYLKLNEIGKAIPYLKHINSENPNYKDVSILLSKYSELNANRNLQIFLMSSSADFVALCRKLVISYYPRAKVKIINIAVNTNEWADILAEIDTSKWSDLIMFRFIRTQGSIGELIIRDFHTHLKEVKAGKGICITVGTYTEEAKKYTEARLIDLIEKDKLQQLLNSLDAKAKAKT